MEKGPKEKLHDFFATQENVDALSKYVELNFNMIMTKMQSEMRRKHEIPPENTNENGYYDLLVTLYSCMFSEMVIAFSGICRSTDAKFIDCIPKNVLLSLLDLLQAKTLDPVIPEILKMRRENMAKDRETFNDYYISQIDELRNNLEALPK